VASAQARQDFSWPPATHRPRRAHHQRLGAWWCPPATPPPQQGLPSTAASVVVPHRVRLCLRRAGLYRASGPARVVLTTRSRHGCRERHRVAAYHAIASRRALPADRFRNDPQALLMTPSPGCLSPPHPPTAAAWWAAGRSPVEHGQAALA